MHRLYTQEDNARLNDLMEMMTQKSEMMDQVTNTLNGEDSNTSTSVSQDKLADLISQQPSAVSFIHKGASPVKWSLDGSLLKPTAAVQLSGKGFAQAYLAQLNQVLYHTQDEPVMDALFDVMHLQELTRKSVVVRITSARYVQRLPLIAQTLTTFFNTNKHVIAAISTMVANNLTEK